MGNRNEKLTNLRIDKLNALADTKVFAPQHDYDAYNAVVAESLQTKTEPSFDQKFQRYADYFNTLMQTRQQIATCTDEVRIQQRREKIQTRLRLLQIYRATDNIRDGK